MQTHSNKYLIVIVHYQNSELTCECIDSLLKADVPAKCILVIDNGSPNKSINLIKEKYPELNFLQSFKNIGFAAANNLGIKFALESKVEFVILLNNDTEVKTNSIRNLITEMEKQNDAAIGTGRIFLPSEQLRIWYNGGKLIKWRGMAKHFDYNKKVSKTSLNNNVLEVNFISGCFMCIRLSFITQLGLLDERYFMYLEDIEFCARAVKKKFKMLFIPSSEIYHKIKVTEGYNFRIIYYSLRNRLLLIDHSFNMIAKMYVHIVLFIKCINWSLFNRHNYKILVRAKKDYKSKYFGELQNSFN